MTPSEYKKMYTLALNGDSDAIHMLMLLCMFDKEEVMEVFNMDWSKF